MSKYNNLSKEELLKLVEKQEVELKTKKYGLVWDSEKELEQVVLDCENNIPILQRVKEKEIKTDDSDDNILIEGDNYHALTCLNYTHKGKIDVIYIDPPYNTGKAKEWVYNDKFVDENDGYRHSKWLNMIEKRLRLARNLMSEKGIIFISIDDNEMAQLKILCDDIFQRNFVCNFIWKKTANPNSTGNNIGIEHEYVLCYSLNKDIAFKLEDLIDEDIEKYKYRDEFYNVKGGYKLVGLNKTGTVSDRRPNLEYEIKAPDGSIIKPKPRWRWSYETFKKGVFENRIVFNQNPKSSFWTIYYKQYMYEDNFGNIVKRGALVKSILENKGRTTDGTLEINNILYNGAFDFPKPVKLIKNLIKSTSTENSTILDFFAGSGTTGQAVLELNKEDDGNRKFILCTNNELNGTGSSLVEKNPNEDKEKFGICQRVTYPRLEKVIKGYNKNGNGEFVDGLGANLQYFKTDLIPVERIDNISDDQRKELTEKAGQMIAIKENTFEEIETNEWYQIFENKDKSRKTAIYFREDESHFNELIEKIGKTKTVLYIFSYSRIDKKIFNYLGKNIVLEVPEPMFEIYKEINLTLKDK